MSPIHIVCFIAVLITPACAGDQDDIDGDLIADIEIGLLAEGDSFLSVQHGTEAILQYGSQGGMHLYTLPRFRGVKGTVYLDRKARLVSDGLLVLRSPTTVLDIPDRGVDQWWHQPSATANFMCPTPIGITVFDQEVEFSYELRDENEQLLAKDSLVLLPRCPDGNDEEFCHNVCSG